MSPETEADEKSREVRLGLVMYGGVSLAIYINGVAHEFFRAVHGSAVYRLIKALTDSDIVVDVISGTSAGGINGIMLSYALCNDRDFAASANLWREYGDIAKLLRSPKDVTTATSILDSEGFYEPNLRKVFEQMGPYSPGTGEDSSEISELDLFVTATDVDGTVYTQFDDAGHPIDVKNHRTVFVLSHRKGRKEPFAPSGPDGSEAKRVTIEALARLSRATSCFPAAFAPVHVSKPAPGVDNADARLQEWGALGKAASFLDGGVLDNKPFTYTLRAIFGRTADREVDRKLFYVEPDPECMKGAEQASTPNMLQAVLAALIGIPGYESIADDLRLLAARNSKLQQYNRLLANFTGSDTSPSPEVQALYDRSRLIALSERVLRGILRTDGHDRLIEPKARAKAAELARDFDTRLPDASVLDQFDVSVRERRIARVTYQIHGLVDTSQGSAITAAEKRQLRVFWRALNGQFKLYEIIQSAMERLIDHAEIGWDKLPVDEIWNHVSAALLTLIDEAAEPAQLIRDQDLDEFLSGEKTTWLDESQLVGVNAKLRERADKIVKEFAQRTFRASDAASATSLLPRLNRYEERLIAAFTGKTGAVYEAWLQFPYVDAHLFPLEMVGDLHEKDIIETIRISPRDAGLGFSKKGFSDKVAGDAVYHFGGFFKRSWRSNDILWGRLDGLCQLVETLLDAERIGELVKDEGSRAKLRKRFFADAAADGSAPDFREGLDPAALFANAGQQTHRKIGAWLRALLSESADERTRALAEAEFKPMAELIVEAAQLEVLQEDFPKVLFDSISEQAQWNTFNVMRGSEARNGAGTHDNGVDAAVIAEVQLQQQEEMAALQRAKVSPATFADRRTFFQRGTASLDPFFANVAAAERTKLAMETFKEPAGPSDGASRPQATRLGQFFQQTYKVGAEELTRDMPPAVLLEILAHGLLVVQNCVLQMFHPSVARNIRRHPIFFFGLAIPLRVFYGAAILNRRAPAWLLALGAAAAAASVVALAVAVVWREKLLQWWNPAFWWLLVIPSVVLLVEVCVAVYWWKITTARKKPAAPPAGAPLNTQQSAVAVQ